MRRKQIAMLLGAVIAFSGACAEDAGDSEVESMTEGMRGLGDKSDMKKPSRYLEKFRARLDLSEGQARERAPKGHQP